MGSTGNPSRAASFCGSRAPKRKKESRQKQVHDGRGLGGWLGIFATRYSTWDPCQLLGSEAPASPSHLGLGATVTAGKTTEVRSAGCAVLCCPALPCTKVLVASRWPPQLKRPRRLGSHHRLRTDLPVLAAEICVHLTTMQIPQIPRYCTEGKFRKSSPSNPLNPASRSRPRSDLRAREQRETLLPGQN